MGYFLVYYGFQTAAKTFYLLYWLLVLNYKKGLSTSFIPEAIYSPIRGTSKFLNNLKVIDRKFVRFIARKGFIFMAQYY